MSPTEQAFFIAWLRSASLIFKRFEQDLCAIMAKLETMSASLDRIEASVTRMEATFDRMDATFDRMDAREAAREGARTHAALIEAPGARLSGRARRRRASSRSAAG